MSLKVQSSDKRCSSLRDYLRDLRALDPMSRQTSEDLRASEKEAALVHSILCGKMNFVFL